MRIALLCVTCTLHAAALRLKSGHKAALKLCPLPPKEAGPNALLIIDVQNDFCEGGALGVVERDASSTPTNPTPCGGPDGIVAGINAFREQFKKEGDMIIHTQDWHPQDHTSFASNNQGKLDVTGKKIKDPFVLRADGQMMWPDHCVQESPGADFFEGLITGVKVAGEGWKEDTIVRKGSNSDVDSYSGFGSLPIYEKEYPRDRIDPTNLHDILQKNGIENVYVVGLAFDYCVAETALDAKMLGYNVMVVKPLTRYVAVGSETAATTKLAEKGIWVGSCGPKSRLTKRVNWRTGVTEYGP